MTENEIIEASVTLIRDYVSAMRDSVAAISRRFSLAGSHPTKKDVALARWHAYLGVMTTDTAESVADLAPARRTRPVIVLNRCIYEYVLKAKYFDGHRKEAYEQFASIGARKFVMASRLDNPSPDLHLLFVSDYLDWKRTSGTRDEYSGNKQVAAMHVALAKAEDVKIDTAGNQYTSAFESVYSVPSLYVHADPVLMRDVFPAMNDDHDWRMKPEEHLLGIHGQLGLTSVYVLDYLSLVAERYGLDRSAFGPLMVRGQTIAIQIMDMRLS
jgi:hypothetical protein